jgi:ubiquinol-cytochrome c reductase subunit 6
MKQHFTMLAEEAEQQQHQEEEEEEEPVDLAPGIREKCGQTSHCNSFKMKLETCTQRVQQYPTHGETCSEEFFDFLHCIDHCVSLVPVFSC